MSLAHSLLDELLKGSQGEGSDVERFIAARRAAFGDA